MAFPLVVSWFTLVTESTKNISCLGTGSLWFGMISYCLGLEQILKTIFLHTVCYSEFRASDSKPGERNYWIIPQGNEEYCQKELGMIQGMTSVTNKIINKLHTHMSHAYPSWALNSPPYHTNESADTWLICCSLGFYLLLSADSYSSEVLQQQWMLSQNELPFKW